MKIRAYKSRVSDGLYSGMPAKEYHAHKNLSSSLLRTLLRSPLEYKRTFDGLLYNEPTAAMEFGTVAHSAILENRFDGFTVRPDTYGEGKRWNSNAAECRDWLAANSDKPVLTVAEMVELKQAADYIHAHAEASKLLRGGVAEVSAFWNGRKARVDYFKTDSDGCTVIDLKTCADASSRAFSGEMLKRGYHIQAAWYASVLLGLGFKWVHFYFVALQKGKLPMVNVWQLGKKSFGLGESECTRALEIKNTCELQKFWPEWNEVPEGEMPFKVIDVPPWALPEEELTGFDEA